MFEDCQYLVGDGRFLVSSRRLRKSVPTAVVDLSCRRVHKIILTA
jgi:hypothetical protein